jgi:FMN reductase
MIEDHRPLVLGLAGSHRPGSITDKATRTALAAAEAAGAQTLLLCGAELAFPAYGTDPTIAEAPALKRFLDMYERCDGLVLASPGYHGSMSGLLKNALDYTDLLREQSKRAYLDNKAVGCIACAHGWQATGTTLVALRTVVHALRGWPTPLGVAINSTHPFISDDGVVLDRAVVDQLNLVGRQIVEFARSRHPAAGRLSLAS